MCKKENMRLFKEKISRTDYAKLIKELSDALDEGTAAVTKLLFATEAPDLYSNHGKYQPGQHKRCEGMKSGRFTEKRLCKCMYYKNSTYSKNCDSCAFAERFDIIGDYKIIDYEQPAFYYGAGIGEIDLIITDGGIRYAAELKPYKSNNESLLRMTAEIMTYTMGYPADKYKKALAFFEKNRDETKTAQQREYENASPELKALLKKADIAVFRFETAGEKAYRICKL